MQTLDYMPEPIKMFLDTAATICYNVQLLLKTNRTICNVFKPRLTANCTFFFMAFLDSFFQSTGSDMDDAFCLPNNFITVGIEFKYSFTFRSEKVVQFKLYKITPNTDITVICDSLK